MHQRLQTDNSIATSVPYGRDTFTEACKQLYQHRSVANAIRRKSAAAFTGRAVAPWKSKPEWGPAVGRSTNEVSRVQTETITR